ncbi:MAG TPA: cytochrome-c peroxidase, partial [Sulfurovum sp.]|nr:cytochrome-c peroxidase [Sulfurovum sp.]
MKGFFHPVMVTFYVVLFILSLPFLLPEKEVVTLSDDALRKTALTRDMTPVPANYEDLLKVVDNPENLMSREKIALGKELFFDTILSQDKSISCASCHNLEEGGDDDIPTAIGYLGQENPFH